MSDLHFWGVSTSRTLRPIWTAEELGLTYGLTPIGPRTGATQERDYLSRNPKGKIPYMVDRDVALSESVAICRYLVQRYSNDDAIANPQSIVGRAKCDEWCFFILGELDETSLYIIRRHEVLKHIYGEAPEAVAVAREYCARQFRAATDLMIGPYVMGEAFGLPDILMMSCITWAERVGVDLPDSMGALRDRIAERPAYQRAVKINQQAAR